MERVFVGAQDLRSFIKGVLLKAKVRDDIAIQVMEGLVQTSLRGVDSHGIRLLPHYLKAVKAGRINPDPKYKFKKTSLSTGLLNADHTFGHAAGMEAVKLAIGLAKEAGTGNVAVYNSTHFGAAAYYALEIAKNDMLGWAFTNTDALIKTYGGRRAYLGNNPICFAAPSKDAGPYCLDMATSVLTFNKIKQLESEGLKAPPGVGANKDGVETTNPKEIAMLLPIGGYKGYGLSMVVEILCSMLTGMAYGPHIPKMFEAPMNQKRFLGHFISAMRIDCFQDKSIFKERLSLMIDELKKEPRFDEDVPVQVADEPQKRHYAQRIEEGVPLTMKDYNLLKEVEKEYSVKLKVTRRGLIG